MKNNFFFDAIFNTFTFSCFHQNRAWCGYRNRDKKTKRPTKWGLRDPSTGSRTIQRIFSQKSFTVDINIEINNNFSISESMLKNNVELNNQESPTHHTKKKIIPRTENILQFHHNYNDQRQAESNFWNNSSLLNAGLHLSLPVSILDENLKRGKEY